MQRKSRRRRAIHGYGIAQRLQLISRDVVQVSSSTACMYLRHVHRAPRQARPRPRLLVADDRPGAEAVAIIGSNIWKSRYGASRDVLGCTVSGERHYSGDDHRLHARRLPFR